VGLAEKRNALTATLSGGQKRKLSVVLAFMGRPKVSLHPHCAALSSHHSLSHSTVSVAYSVSHCDYYGVFLTLTLIVSPAVVSLAVSPTVSLPVSLSPSLLLCLPSRVYFALSHQTDSPIVSPSRTLSLSLSLTHSLRWCFWTSPPPAWTRTRAV
jgi:hypothetical protein